MREDEGNVEFSGFEKRNISIVNLKLKTSNFESITKLRLQHLQANQNLLFKLNYLLKPIPES